MKETRQWALEQALYAPEYDVREAAKKSLRNRRNSARRREREEVMKGLGLVKVRGNLGGTYWE